MTFVKAFNQKPPAAAPWKYPEESEDGNVYQYLRDRELNSRRGPILPMGLQNQRYPHSLSRYIHQRLPEVLLESPFDLSGYDKVFASHWLSNDEIVLGTKCNKIIVINLSSNKKFEIPLVGSKLPHPRRNAIEVLSSQEPSRQPSVTTRNPPSTSPVDRVRSASSTSRSTNSSPSNGIHPTTSSRAGPNQGRATPSTEEEFERNLMGRLQNRGIHSIAVNPSKTLIATGGANFTDVAVYSLPTFEPVALFQGHSDCVFTLDWIDDTHFISGSRDYKVNLWEVPRDSVDTTSDMEITVDHDLGDPMDIDLTQPEPPCSYNSTPALMVPTAPKRTFSEHDNKVRDLKHNPLSREIATLGAGGIVKIWDAQQMRVTSDIELTQSIETVTIAADNGRNLYAVGSQNHVTLLDPRCGENSQVASYGSVDEGSGVRSLSFNNSILTVGGGLGRLSWIDLRKGEYITAGAEKFRKSSSGWLRRDILYTHLFNGAVVHSAICTHSYDPTGTRLFAAGGPLQVALCGSYAALWK